MSNKLLVIGGSGFVSGTLARLAVARGFDCHVVTRGERPLPTGVTGIVADRKDRDGFRLAIAAFEQTWDLVVDCIGYTPEDAAQDVEVFCERTEQLVFISSDFVFEPAKRRFLQSEEGTYRMDRYGGLKRECELVLENSDCGEMAWTVLRPCHIYGPGSELGCLPHHGRDKELIQKMRNGETLALVGGGHFLQQPIFAPDLAELILSVYGNTQANRTIFQAAGPDIVESRAYYQIVADILGVPLNVEEVSVMETLAETPTLSDFFCHRIYDLTKLKECGLAIPSTPLAEGLEQHVAAKLEL